MTPTAWPCAAERGVTVIAMTAEHSGFPSAWARKVGVEHVVLGVQDKAAALVHACESHAVGLDEVCVVGDDWSDVPAFSLVRDKGGMTCRGGRRPARDRGPGPLPLHRARRRRRRPRGVRPHRGRPHRGQTATEE